MHSNKLPPNKASRTIQTNQVIFLVLSTFVYFHWQIIYILTYMYMNVYIYIYTYIYLVYIYIKQIKLPPSRASRSDDPMDIFIISYIQRLLCR
jgi:hypothetical protein